MRLIPLNEQDLLKRLKAGDEKAFEQLYRIYSPPIFKKLLRLLKQEAIAQELLQDVFMKIWEKRETIDIEKSLRSYLYCIATNLVTDMFRRAAYDRKLLDHLIVVSTELYNPVEDGMNLKEGNEILQKCINNLPPQRQKVYILCKIEGKSYQEVSDLLGISTSTISDHIVKATRALKMQFSSNEVIISLLAVLILASF